MDTACNPQIISYPDGLFRENIGIPNLPSHGQSSASATEECRLMARTFCRQAFNNLDSFPYLYFTSGVTEGIDHLVPRQETGILKNEYRYVRGFSTVSDASVNPKKAFFYTYPFSGTGRFETIPDQKNIILDCSYFFASNMKGAGSLPDSVNYALFGLSKSHNLSDARIGWMFSKQKIITYHVLQYEYGYINGLVFPTLKRALGLAPNE